MTNEELVTLAKQGDQAAKEELFSINLKFSNHIANKFCSFKDSRYEDFVAVANLGMVKAFNSFDPAIGANFITFAARCMFSEILMFLRKQRRNIPTTNLESSLVGKRTGESFCLLDILYDETDLVRVYEDVEELNRVRDLLKILPPIYQTVAIGCFFNGKSQTEVAEEIGLSRAYVSMLSSRMQAMFQKYRDDGVFTAKGRTKNLKWVAK